MVISPPKDLENLFGFDYLYEASPLRLEVLESHSPSVVVFFYNSKAPEPVEASLKTLREAFPEAATLLVAKNLEFSSLRKFKNQGLLRARLESAEEPKFSGWIQELLSEKVAEEQQQVIHTLYEDQNQRLAKLNEELEERVVKRQSYLLKSQKTLKKQKERARNLHFALLSIFQGETIPQIETYMMKVLSQSLNLEWLKVRFFSQSALTSRVEAASSDTCFLDVPLRSGDKLAGHLLLKKKENGFTADEKEFVHEVAQSLSLAVSRIIKKQVAENLKQQWESTFDAITPPVCLTDENFLILRMNKNFCEIAQIEFTKALGQKALTVFAGPESEAALDILKTESFVLLTKTSPHEERYFEVSLHTLTRLEPDEPAYMLFFKDVTEERRMNAQI
ncbi:MAG: PAS domain-containing protein, partial [Bdellovibrionales bacterium]|nr:PAS domain-containing protein [Bdellovibrionales bacterium]